MSTLFKRLLPVDDDGDRIPGPFTVLEKVSWWVIRYPNAIKYSLNEYINLHRGVEGDDET